MTISANPLDGGSETLDATSLDNPANWEFHDPVTDGANEEEQKEGIESEAETEATIEDETETVEEVDAQPEQEGEESDTSEELDESQTEDENDDSKPETFTLSDGQEVSRDELIAGYWREKDYRIKTSQLAEGRKTVEAQAQRLQRQVETLTNYLANALPQEPEAALAYSDPSAYTAQKAAYDQQINHLHQLLAIAEEPRQIQEELTADVTKEELEEENAKLRAAFPMTANKDGRSQFFNQVFSAAEQVGFSQDEMKAATDSRLLGLAYYAQIGMQAEKAKAKAKTKVKNAPKAAPKRARTVQRSNDAMKKLQKSGSIHDAVMVDFE
ncbi:MAG: hypothetical protein AAFW66_00090 [Pseudomonadota bacterium]